MNATKQARARGWRCVRAGLWVKIVDCVWKSGGWWFGGIQFGSWPKKAKVGPYPTMLAAMDALESEETTPDA